MSEVPSILIELGFICDKEFSEQFQFNEQRIKQYIVNAFGGIEADFQTLNLVHVQFAITTVSIIRDTESQPFVESVRNADGETVVASIQTKFQQWVYHTKIANDSDIVVLLTGSKGRDSYTTANADSCVSDQASERYKSILIFRAAENHWLHPYYYSYAIGVTLGAISENETPCNNRSRLMSYSSSTKEQHYFSTCSDRQIKEFLESSKAHCLKNNQICDTSKKLNNIKRVPLSFTQQCQLRNLQHEHVTTKPNSENCLATHCYKNTSNDLEYLNYFYPLDGTPCGRNKICFRGNCRSDGLLIKTVRSQKCILPSYIMHPRDKIILAHCPSFPINFDKFSISYNDRLGVFLSAPSNNIDFNDTALTFSTNRIEFSDMNSTSFDINSVLWDILEVDDGSHDVLICHRQTKKCISTGSKDKLILDDGADATDFSKRWKLDNNSNIFYPTYKRKAVETEHVIEKHIRLAIICDFNCGKAFMFNETASRNYWKVLLADATSKFETLATLKISFLVTSLINLWGIGYSKLAGKTIYSSNSESLELINESFGLWLYGQLDGLPQFDIGVLGTAFLETKLKTFANQASACNTNENSERIPGTLVYRVDMPKTNDFLELADSLGKILEQKENINSGSVERKYTCSKNPLSFSKCQEKQMRQYLVSEKGNCLTYKDDEFKFEFLHNGKIKLPSFQEQCNFLPNQSDLIVKEKDENCLITRCLKNEGKNLFVQNIYPLHGTPCGIDKHCLWGNCVSKGYPLKKVETTMCLSGTRLFSPNDLVTLSDCRAVSSHFHHFAITELSDKTGYILVSPISPAYKTESDGKCLTWEPEREYLHYNPCADGNFEKFVWNIFDVPNSNGQFLLYHKLSKKCIGVTHKTVFSSNTNCEFQDLHSNETFVYQGCTMPTKPFYYMQFFSDSTCSIMNMSLRWQRLSISSKDLENVDSYFSPKLSKSADQDERALTETSNVWIYVLAGVVILFALLASITGFVMYRRRFAPGNRNLQRYEWLVGESFYLGNVERINPDLNITAQADLLPFDSRLEFPFDQLQLGKFLGAGAYYKVFEAKAFGITTNHDFMHVAVKIVEATTGSTVDHFRALLPELKILCYIGRHLNVAGLLGACTKDFSHTKKMCMITEYCKHGNLRNFLINNRNSFVNDASLNCTNGPGTMSRKGNNQALDHFISMQDLIAWSFQLAQGMEYLASKKVLHGDLATRNVLLAENYVLKICNFGFPRELAQGYNQKNVMADTKMPFKWMAIESIKYGLFSSQSDCWAFGVAVWEIFSLGATPYAGTELDENFVSRLCNGHRLKKPEFAPSRIYDIMNQCWSQEPDTRPKFSELVANLGEMLTAGLCKYHAQLNEEIQNNLIYEEIGNSTTNITTKKEWMDVENSQGYMPPVLRPEYCSTQCEEPSVTCSLLENKQGFKFEKEQNLL